MNSKYLSFDAMVAESIALFNTHVAKGSPEEQSFREMWEQGKLSLYHMTIGMRIRDRYGLWNEEHPVTARWIAEGKHSDSEDHPDQYSSKIMHAVFDACFASNAIYRTAKLSIIKKSNHNSSAIIAAAVDAIKERLVNNLPIYGCLDPEVSFKRPYVDLQMISHEIVGINVIDDVVLCTVKILHTPQGNILKELRTIPLRLSMFGECDYEVGIHKGRVGTNVVNFKVYGINFVPDNSTLKD